MADTDGDGPDRTRKIKIRRAHRSSATRLCNSVYENIKAEVVNVAKLRQQRQSITEKVQTLAKLDGEMLDLVEEEALETEIEQADIVRGLPYVLLTLMRPLELPRPEAHPQSPF